MKLKVLQAFKKGARADLLSPNTAKAPYSALIGAVQAAIRNQDNTNAVEVVRTILSSDTGADPNEINHVYGWTPLSAAALKGHKVPRFPHLITDARTGWKAFCTGACRSAHHWRYILVFDEPVRLRLRKGLAGRPPRLDWTGLDWTGSASVV